MSIFEQIELAADIAWQKSYPIEPSQMKYIREYCELLEMPIPDLIGMTIWQAERLLDKLDNTLVYGVPFDEQ